MRIESVWNLHEIIYETVFESISDSKNQLIEKITGWMVDEYDMVMVLSHEFDWNGSWHRTLGWLATALSLADFQ